MVTMIYTQHEIHMYQNITWSPTYKTEFIIKLMIKNKIDA